ncbi:galactokinase [bacterium]|nr:galactokinase [bacterium]
MISLDTLLCEAANGCSNLARHVRAIHAGSGEAAADALRRVRRLAAAFSQAYPEANEVFVVRAPGRVNLIGEHTDYNGLPVMPMAISRDVLIMAAPAAGPVSRAVNTDARFAPREFAIERSIPPFERGDWGNYLKSATQGLVDHWGGSDGLRGVLMAVDGTVPIASGLSSSAAFTIAAALALLHANRRTIEPREFAERMASSDHYVGMASGGMDQAAAILGQTGKALKIDFHPLRVQAVALPADAAIVVCNSRVEAAKAGSARDGYNRRTVECRLAAAVLHARGAGMSKPAPALLGEWLANETNGFDDALRKIDLLLHEGGYPIPELCTALDITAETAAGVYCKTKAGDRYPEPSGGFELKKRARHVITEARRVAQSFELLNRMPKDAARQFGALMNASHQSCRDDYEISCAELDELVSAARKAGAFGARLTGAGFGGCTVNLVPAADVAAFMKAVAGAYYTPRGMADLPDNQFAFSPASGAGVLVT